MLILSYYNLFQFVLLSFVTGYLVLGIKLSPETLPHVQTSKGRMVGSIVLTARDNVGFAFQGVPFGEAPVGDRRFGKAEPKQPWTGELKADKDGPICVQPNLFHRQMSEDCLTLDVYVPVQDLSKTPNKTYAVMLYCFGGNYDFGSPNDYAPAYLIDHFVSRDVIVVIPNYRTNIFGLFTTGNDVVRGNAGLHDIILALQWVQTDISHFGGDPTKVTIQGESSGGHAASSVAVSPLSEGLISQALLMSGSFFDNEGTEFPDLDLNRDIAAEVGCNEGQLWENGNFTEVVSCMQKTEAQVLLDAYNNAKASVRADPYGKGGDRNPGKPIVDGPGGVLPGYHDEMARTRHPLKAAMTGTLIREIHVDLGVNATATLARLGCDSIANYRGTEYTDIIKKACQMYYVDRFTDPHSDDDYKFWNRQINAIMNDNTFFSPSLHEAISLVDTGTPKVYIYSFEYPKDGTPPEAGPNHAQDLMYIFGFPPYFPDEAYTAKDAQMGEIYADLLCNFIKFGNPTPDGSKYPVWNPIANKRQLDYYHINITKQSADKYYRDSAYEFYVQLVPLLLQSAKQGVNTTKQLDNFIQAISSKSAAIKQNPSSSPGSSSSISGIAIGILASVAALVAIVGALAAMRSRRKKSLKSSVHATEEKSLLLDASEA